jgi:hypothetical protein
MLLGSGDDLLERWDETGPGTETRNPKSETRNKFQIPKSKVSNLAVAGLEHFRFLLGICFEFRVSDFGFEVCAGRACLPPTPGVAITGRREDQVHG